MNNKIILDLCGGTGSWSEPYKEAGYDVRIITLPEHDVCTYEPPKNVYGILAAPPCTEFSIAKGSSLRDFETALQVVDACIKIVWKCRMDGTLRFWAQNKDCYLIHLGDHDPSGIDMTRDISDRLELFGANVEVLRIALNFDQIEEFAPPPNPAKVTDSRAGAYIKAYGKSSWELDALEPHILTGLISEQIEWLTDDELLCLERLKLSEHKQEMQKYLSKIS